MQIVQPAVECEQNTHCRYNNSLCIARLAVLHTNKHMQYMYIYTRMVGLVRFFDVIDYDEAFTYTSAYPLPPHIHRSLRVNNSSNAKCVENK